MEAPTNPSVCIQMASRERSLVENLVLYLYKSNFVSRFNKMNDHLMNSFTNYVDIKLATLKEDLEVGSEMEMVDLETEQNLAKFFEEFGGIKEYMETIKELIVKLQNFNEETKSIHKAPTMKYLRD